MKIVFLDTYYPGFLRSFYQNHSDLSKSKYATIKNKLLASLFGTSNFFSSEFKTLGWKVDDLILNDEILQRKWAKENGINVSESTLISKIKSLPYACKIIGRPKWIEEIALRQIMRETPDVLYFQDLSIFSPTALKKAKKYCSLLVGQIASPLPPKKNLECFDLIITSFPHYVKLFKKMGIKSEYHKLAFETKLLKKIKPQKRIYNVTFVGSFSPYHKKGTEILEKIAEKVPIHVWGNGLEFLSPLSPLRNNFHGQAWGLNMYKVLAKSKIVINRHIKVADGYANNMRLYEATGMGAMLITDKKKNLGKLFKVGKEILAYRNSEDLTRKIRYYLHNDSKRMRIAIAGQKRTLKSHNYLIEMKRLSELIKNYL